jgi:hypothetical protein
MNEWMSIDFLSFKAKRPSQYFGSIFIHKEKHIQMLRIMRKWPRIWKKQDVKLRDSPKYIQTQISIQ